MIKLIRTGDLRKALDKYNREEISYGKMVQMLNEAANKALNKAFIMKTLQEQNETKSIRHITKKS